MIKLADFKKELIGSQLEAVYQTYTTDAGLVYDYSLFRKFRGAGTVEKVTASRIYVRDAAGQEVVIEFGRSADWNFDGDLACFALESGSGIQESVYYLRRK